MAKAQEIIGLDDELRAIAASAPLSQGTIEQAENAIQTKSETAVTAAFETANAEIPSIDSLFLDINLAFNAVESAANNQLIKEEPEIVSIRDQTRGLFDDVKDRKPELSAKLNNARTLLAAIRKGGFIGASANLNTRGIDQLKVKVTLTEQAKTEEIPLVFDVVGGRRPTFSTGVFFVTLKDPTFSSSGGAAPTIRQDPTSSFSPSLGALIHTPGLFRSKDINIPFSFGVGLHNSNPVYFAGPSLIIGRKQRTIITAGIAAGQVSRLNGVNIGDPVPSSGAIPTTKVYRTKFFVGVTYNLD